MLNSLENNDLFDASTHRLTLKEDETLLPKNSHPKKKTSNQSLKVNPHKTIYLFSYLMITRHISQY